MNEERFFKDERLSFVEGRFSRDSSRLFKPHMHRRFSVGAASDGTLSFIIDSNSITLKPGSLALINPETLHSCNPATSNHSRSYYMLHLDTSWCLTIQQTLFPVTSFLPVHTLMVDDMEISMLFLDSMECIMSPKNTIQQKEQSLSTLTTFIFARACPESSKVQPAKSSDVERLKQLLSENLDQDYPLAIAAEALNSNPYTLLRQFKRNTGITPHAYRMNCRIEHARRLLQQGLDITETALLCGFFDQSHFHRHFKAMTTVTPGEYRRGLIGSIPDRIPGTINAPNG